MPGRLESLQRHWAERPAVLRLAAEVGAAAAAAAAAAALPRIPQPQSYHSFAGDHRTLLGIPHAPNVLSNAVIALPGAMGLWRLLTHAQRRSRHSGRGVVRLSAAEAACWGAAFFCMLLAAAGSAGYHLHPTNASLAWDRGGMALTFAALLSAVIGERRSPAAGLACLGPLLYAAAGSVAQWLASEQAGRGDLRRYLLVQGLAAAGIGYLAAAYPPPPGRSTTPRILHTLALYAAAVAGDRLDRPVYWLTLRAVSGHTLKHLLAGAAGWQLVRMLGET